MDFKKQLVDLNIKIKKLNLQAEWARADHYPNSSSSDKDVGLTLGTAMTMLAPNAVGGDQGFGAVNSKLIADLLAAKDR